MNHKHDVNQVLLKFGLLLTSLVGMAPLSSSLNNFLSFCDLCIPIHTCDSCFWLFVFVSVLFFLFFLFFSKTN